MVFLSNVRRSPTRNDISVPFVLQTFGNDTSLQFILQRQTLRGLYCLEKRVFNSVGYKRCLAADSALVCGSTQALFVAITPDSSWSLGCFFHGFCIQYILSCSYAALRNFLGAWSTLEWYLMALSTTNGTTAWIFLVPRVQFCSSAYTFILLLYIRIEIGYEKYALESRFGLERVCCVL
jgi:hypothetical protein